MRSSAQFHGSLVFVALAALAAPVAAQEAEPVMVDCPLFQRLSHSRATAECHRIRTTAVPFGREAPVARTGIDLLPSRLYTGFRSGYPAHRNRGLAWGGKGLATQLTTGVRFGAGPLTVVLEPEVAWIQNRSFLVPEERRGSAAQLSPFAYPWGRQIDQPLRFGADAFFVESLGQSYVELAWRAGRAGLSNENLWLGPARRYPLIVSNSASGFPHVFFETAGPRETRFGTFDAGLLWGLLRESGYFRPATLQEDRVFTLARMSYSLPFFEELELGAALTYQERVQDGLGPEYLNIFSGLTWGPEQDERIGASDGKMSVHARWRLPDPGFEAWVELARDDHWMHSEDLITQPNHSLVFLAGFEREQVDPGGRSGWRVTGEFANTKISRPQQANRGGPQPFYVHSQIVEGHTHRGLPVGPFIGSGSDAQYLAFEWWREGLRWGVFAERIVWDDDTYHLYFEDVYTFRGHDLEWTVGARLGRAFGPLRAGTQVGLSRRKNRNFVGLDRVNWDLVREWNLVIDVDLAWDPPR